jgi:hypothetical protein
MSMRRAISAAVAALLGLMLCSVQAAAHHGWRWTEEGNFEVTGVIKSVELGNPHGVLVIDVEGEEWLVEVGAPSRNARAGLEDQLLQVGVEVLISGHRSAEEGERRVKAERVYIGGVEYNLYPERD